MPKVDPKGLKDGLASRTVEGVCLEPGRHGGLGRDDGLDAKSAEVMVCLGVPGQIVDIDEADPLFRSARVSFSGIVKEVSLACLPEAGHGDWVLVHAGLAIARLDEAEAEQQLADIRRIVELSELSELSDEPPRSP